MIVPERIKEAYKGYRRIEEVSQTDLYTDEELHALSYVYKAERFILERVAMHTFEAFDSMYAAGARSKEDYHKLIMVNNEVTPEKEFTMSAFHDILDRRYSKNSVVMFIYENFDKIFSEEGFNAIREEADVRRRH